MKNRSWRSTIKFWGAYFETDPYFPTSFKNAHAFGDRASVGVVWGGDGRSGAEWANNVPMTFPCTCIWCYATQIHSVFTRMWTCIWCYASRCLLVCAHALDATPLDVYLHVQCTHTWCYTTGCLLACAHAFNAMPLNVYLHVHMHLMLRHSMFTRMCTCIWCYATRWLLACAHALDATPLDIDILACAHVLDAEGFWPLCPNFQS